MMTISVLMSVYRSEMSDNLDRALQSVWMDQTLKPQEIILVKDGPLTSDLDNVIVKWEKLLDKKLVVLKNETNIGLTKSLNKGLDVAHGELIARMESDDISEPKRFELQVAYLTEHPDIDIVGGSLKEFNEKNDCLCIRHYPLTHQQVLKYISMASPLAHPTVMMRKRIFDNGLRYNEKYRMSQDIALCYDAISAGFKIANVPEVTINFRRQGGVFKRRSREKAWNEFKIYMGGIYRLHGIFTPLYRFPFSRLCFRLMPTWFVKRVYQSNVRSKLLETKQ